MSQTKQAHCKTKRPSDQENTHQKIPSLPLPPIYRSTNDYYYYNMNHTFTSNHNSTTTTTTTSTCHDYYYHHYNHHQHPQQPITTTTTTTTPYDNPLIIENKHVSLLALIDTVYPPLQCTECDAVSPTRQEEQSHFHIHPPRFYCLHPHCELSFRTKSALRFHISRFHLVHHQKPILPLPTMITKPIASTATASLSSSNNNSNNLEITLLTTIDSVPTTPTGTSPPTPPILATTTTAATATVVETSVTESESMTPTTVHAVPSPSPSPSPVIIKKQPSIPSSPSSSPLVQPLHQQQQQESASPSSLSSTLSSPPLPPLSSSASSPSSSQQKKRKQKPPSQPKQKKEKKQSPLVSQPTTQNQKPAIPSWRVSSFGRSTTASRAPRGSKKIVLSTETDALLNSVYHPLKCPSCHQRFNRKTNVIKHLTDQHYGEEPYRCVFKECVHPKLYATREGLVYHILRVHDQPSSSNTTTPSSSQPSSPPPPTTTIPSTTTTTTTTTSSNHLHLHPNQHNHTMTTKTVRPANDHHPHPHNKIQHSAKRRRVMVDR
ncbi:hypothetical protein BDA99DRAFT_516231 [Phascolomyces articulosus]|uniref:C2H2-type domain-containing protein n=1 Tax=Phascolomyces articulosus TaxID=60185 RepID=A0AAD5PCA8_9FUNG|nr:hypothetical protein BDA99DRAFT_516231 [Phascolomyces articulosus]